MATVATMGTSTISEVLRLKYFKATLETNLRNALVCEKICTVDRSDSKYLANPYGNQPSANIAAVAGTYTVNTVTTTDQHISVTDQVTYGEHIFEFEETLSRFDYFASRVDEMTYAIAAGIDKYVLNKITDVATGAYTTPAGGFTTAANINVIMGNLLSKVAGYADTYKGLFLVIENTDVPGFVQAQATNGFSFADAALNNGWMSSYMGVDIYVIRTGTFVTATVGTLTAVNSGHRLFGVKGVAVYLAPRGVQYQEKMITSVTGKEIGVWANIGADIWTPKRGLLVDITLA
jgi:hypothetical protein